MLAEVSLNDVYLRIVQKDNFVLNIVAQWCPDCTERQKKFIDYFADALQVAGLDLLQLNVQINKKVYLDAQHEQFVAELGGHGFPRTVLFISGKVVDADNVEVITQEGLQALAEKFSNIVMT